MKRFDKISIFFLFYNLNNFTLIIVNNPNHPFSA